MTRGGVAIRGGKAATFSRYAFHSFLALSSVNGSARLHSLRSQCIASVSGIQPSKNFVMTGMFCRALCFSATSAALSRYNAGERRDRTAAPVKEFPPMRRVLLPSSRSPVEQKRKLTTALYQRFPLTRILV